MLIMNFWPSIVLYLHEFGGKTCKMFMANVCFNILCLCYMQHSFIKIGDIQGMSETGQGPIHILYLMHRSDTTNNNNW